MRADWTEWVRRKPGKPARFCKAAEALYSEILLETLVSFDFAVPRNDQEIGAIPLPCAWLTAPESGRA